MGKRELWYDTKERLHAFSRELTPRCFTNYRTTGGKYRMSHMLSHTPHRLASHFSRRAWSRAQLSHRDPHWIGPDIIPGGVLLLVLTPLRLQSN